MKQIYNFIFALSSIACMTAQTGNAQVKTLNGKIADLNSGKEVEYAYILNYSTQEQTYSNSKGEFTLRVFEGDTIVLYGIGYYYHKVIIEPGMLLNGQFLFSLEEQPVELAEARIPVIGSYQDFKRKFVSVETPVTRTDELNAHIAGASRSIAVEAYEKAKAESKLEGVTIGVANIYTPEEKERMKLAGIKKKEQVRDQIYQKFNPLMVKNLTGLTNDDDIIAFMVFCKFTDKYLLTVNEMDLADTIVFKYELFKRKKEDEHLMQKPLNYKEGFPDTLASL